MTLLKINTGNISILILTVIVFVFLHSEFGLFDDHGDDHGTHDYCELVKSAAAGSSANQSVLKMKIDRIISFHNPDEIEEFYKTTGIKISDHFYPLLKTTEAYLFNRSFLI